MSRAAAGGLGFRAAKSPHQKKRDIRKDVSFLLVREAGLEPARPEWTLEPESSESANSTTRASNK